MTSLMNGDDIFDEWPKESLSPIHPKKRIMTEHQFDSSTEGFPHELHRVGGANMVREYNQRKEQTSANPSDDEDSVFISANSLIIYERAYACYRPEPGESNVESAERHRLIEERVTQLKQARRKKIKPPHSTKHHTTRDDKRTTKQENGTNKEGYQDTTQTSTNRIINHKSHKQHATLHVRRGSYTTSSHTNNHTPNQRDHGHRRNIHHVTWRLRFTLSKAALR